MKVLEQFMIALGLKVDEKSFQQGQNAFTGLTNSALKLGAVLASKLAIDKVVGDFKSAGTELDKFNRLTGISTQRVQAFGQALAAQGGNAQDALGTFQKMQDLMSSPMTGNVGWFGDVAKLGLDPGAIIGAQDTADALLNIAKQFEHMTPLNQRLAAKALGLNEDEARVVMAGSAALEKQLETRGKLGIMTGKQVEDAARLTKATSELDLVFTDIGNTIAGELTPAFAEMAEDFTQFYRDNKELINSGLETFFGAVAKNIEGVAIAMALMGGASALKGLAALAALMNLSKKGVPPAPGAPGGPGGSGKPGGGGGLPFFVNPLTAGLAALFYSSSLNEGEDDEVAKIRMRNGGADGAGAVIDYLKSKGLSETLAKGIAANVQAESSFDPKAVGDGGKAYGLLQLHPPRQADFAAYSGKDIRQSTWQEQLDFAVYEATKGKEKASWAKVENSQSPSEAASNYSKYVIRPAEKERRARERAEIAEGYGSRAAYAGEPSVAPELTQAQIDKMLGRASVIEHIKALQDGNQPGLWDTLDAWAKSQRRAPEAYTASDVVAPSVPAPISQSSSTLPERPVQNIDNRQFHIHGADTGKVEQLWNEKLSKLIDQTTQDFRSPEK
ncbi:phage tail tip lysozyme [Pseudomonas juntendi]|uniref:Phage tail tip lysozyme n=1 Tax=Pseudomonas juntendi TaxID=2666183 RepID=A0ABD4YFL6_9PSED|nr:phage tail tip lysozyme [Pseudomonas juntendi]MDH0758009.1 phage tail tip lysozyme [Pseudomonas juntendi]MDH1919509.1 phage tail tip lysozyme [Pseudomonas juntendi]